MGLGGIGNGVNRQGLRSKVAGVMAHRLHRSHRFLSPAEIKEIEEIFFHTEITEITESAFGTGCAQ